MDTTTLNSIPLLITDRLVLLPPNDSLAQAALEYYVENISDFRHYMPMPNDDTLNIKSQMLRIFFEQDLIDQDRLIKFYIFDKNDVEYRRLLGDISFFNILRGDASSCLVGAKMSIEFRGKGFMYEALARAIAYIYNEQKLHRLEANIMKSNLASINLVKKLGFVEEGVSRSYLKIKDQWIDHLRYSIINPAT